ncbi:hypothetical protein HYQ45_016274 [Verticillium longisporum]|uniref:Uncharacterized protein n=1 Tax=Verticillium longisporum TaxID=100787 RepID=A0A8I2Z4P9_VERLO|nr:hypothetical protein HYQ45_016274 [Verticillium longisporum]
MAFMYVGTAAQEVDGDTMAVEDVVRLGGGKPDDWGVPNSESYKAANTVQHDEPLREEAFMRPKGTITNDNDLPLVMSACLIRRDNANKT